MDVGTGITIVKRKPLVILEEVDLVLGNGGTFNQPGVDVKGFRKIKVYFQTPTAAAAAGFPRIRMGPDGVSFPLVFVMQRDFAREADLGAPFVYTFDGEIMARFVAVEWTSGALGASPLVCQATVEP